jgi:hypothetical protein
MSMNIDHEVIRFGFNVHKHAEVRRLILDTLTEYIGPSFVVDDWVFEVEVDFKGERRDDYIHDKVWSVNVTAGYTG